jgi:dipeptidase E
MRLYLSSFRMGDHPERLLALLDGFGPAAVIANATDGYPDGDRTEAVERELNALKELGIVGEELDLRDHFAAGERLTADLARYRLVWARGGNTFLLRYALAASGADTLLTDLLRRDAVVYGGYSAGVCVLAPSLHGLELADSPDAVPECYGAPAIWDGLGLLDYAIVPHFESPDQPESEASGRMAKRYRAEGVTHRTLRDGQAIVIDGDTTTVY